MDFQRNKTKRKERMKNTKTESTGRWAQYILWYSEGKTGESVVPLGLQNITIKRGKGLRRKAEKFGMGESLIKFCREEKLKEKLVKLLPGILEKSTIAHTRIQKESNFASLKG